MWTPEGELGPRGRRLTKVLILLYTLCLIYLCFSPQYYMVKDVSTPNIIYLGRVPVLLVPFNTFLNLDRLPTFKAVFWVVGQNISNLFLLTPIWLGILFLKPAYRKTKLVLFGSFIMSLTIELTQVVLDLTLDFNRVFEVDDLIFNTLGGLVALWLIPVLKLLLSKLARNKD